MRRPFLIERSLIAALIVFFSVGHWVTQAQADQLPFPEPANENTYAVPIENFRLRLWAQYRVMYNASNIPGLPSARYSDSIFCAIMVMIFQSGGPLANRARPNLAGEGLFGGTGYSE